MSLRPAFNVKDVSPYCRQPDALERGCPRPRSVGELEMHGDVNLLVKPTRLR